MNSETATVKQVALEKDDVGNFSFPESHKFDAGYGLTKDTIDYISKVKDEPAWVNEFRHKALNTFESKPMPDSVIDYRAIYDSAMLRVYHLQGEERTFRIEAALTCKLKDRSGEVSKKPAVRFEKVSLPLVLNKTNGETVARLYGNDPKQWVGEAVTLYPTTTSVGGKTVECIRIRPQKPQPKEQA